MRMLLLLWMLIMAAPLLAAEADSGGDREVQGVEGISVRASDEQPRVLHIVPWQPPSLARRARPELRLEPLAPVLEPIEPETLEAHRRFRRTLHLLENPTLVP